MKQQAFLVLAGLALVLVFGYQNCSNGMSFQTADPAVFKIGTEDAETGGDPVAMLPPGDTDGDSDTDIDYDFENRRVLINCSTGASLRFNEAELAAAPDLTLANIRKFISYYPNALRNVSVSNIKGSIAIKKALRISQMSNLESIVAYARAVDVVSSSNIRAGISVTAANTLGELSNVHAAYTCASGAEIGKISNIHSVAMKFRGRTSASGANSQAEELSNLHAGFVSVYRIDARKISNVSGELIIRNSVIDSLENFKGGLTLINSKVKSFKNGQGRIRLLDSSIDTQDNVNMDTVYLVKK